LIPADFSSDLEKSLELENPGWSRVTIVDKRTPMARLSVATAATVYYQHPNLFKLQHTLLQILSGQVSREPRHKFSNTSRLNLPTYAMDVRAAVRHILHK
jgi:hypothetical protein